MDLFAYIGETLRRVRKERGKTLEEVSQEAGLGRGQLSRIENGRQSPTLSTLSKVLISQRVTRRELIQRYELVETEAEALERQGGVPAPADRKDEWPEEVREALKQVESFVTAGFLQPRLAQGAIELGEVVILFRVLSKKDLEKKEAPVEAPAPAPKPASRPPSKRPSRRRKTR